MKILARSSGILALASLALLASQSHGLDYQSTGEDPSNPHFRIEPNHYLDFPVLKKDFSNWQTMGAAVIMKNRSILAPEVKDKKGIMYAKNPNPLVKDWMLDVELNLGNTKRTARGGTGLGIFYLKSVDKVSHKESIFGYTNRFEGLGIYLNTIMKSESRGPSKEINNAIQGFFNDGTRPINIFTEKKHQCFKHYRNSPEGQNVKLRITYDSPFVSVSVFDVYTQAFEFCFSFEANLDYEGYFLFSGSSGVHNPDHVYIHSVKLYDPKTPATNDHFVEARRIKALGDDSKLSAAGKDLLEHQSQKDSHQRKGATDQNMTELFALIPQTHNHIQHRLQETITDYESANERFFETLRGLPNKQAQSLLIEKLFSMRHVVTTLNQAIENESKQLRDYEKTLKQIKYTNNLQRGLQQREAVNPQIITIQNDISEIDRQLQATATIFQEYQRSVQALNAKIKDEAGFTGKLEKERRQFAKELSEELQYDMRDIDDFFDDMELKTVNTGLGMGTLIVNVGMVAVIAVAIMLWLKLNKYQTKHE